MGFYLFFFFLQFFKINKKIKLRTLKHIYMYECEYNSLFE